MDSSCHIKTACQGIYSRLKLAMDEKSKRLVLGACADLIGRGGISLMAKISGADRQAVSFAKTQINSLSNEKEDSSSPSNESEMIRFGNKPGAGRKSIVAKEKGIEDSLSDLMEPHAKGAPKGPLTWTCKSCRYLAKELVAQGRAVSHTTVATLLGAMGYKFIAGNKLKEETLVHPNRNTQFKYINDKTALF